MKPTIIIRMNASEDTVTVDGTVFDRSELNPQGRNKLRRLLVDGWRKVNGGKQ